MVSQIRTLRTSTPIYSVPIADSCFAFRCFAAPFLFFVLLSSIYLVGLEPLNIRRRIACRLVVCSVLPLNTHTCSLLLFLLLPLSHATCHMSPIVQPHTPKRRFRKINLSHRCVPYLLSMASSPLPSPSPSPLLLLSPKAVATLSRPGLRRWDACAAHLTTFLKPLIRAYLLGYAFSVGPRLLALVLHHVLTLVRRRLSGASDAVQKKPKTGFLESMLKTLRAGLEWQRFPAFCAALVGGSTLFEVYTRSSVTFMSLTLA